MDKYEYVLAELNRRRDQLEVVAAGAEVTRRTLYNLLEKKFKPRMETLDSVYEYLRSTSRKKRL